VERPQTFDVLQERAERVCDPFNLTPVATAPGSNGSPARSYHAGKPIGPLPALYGPKASNSNCITSRRHRARQDKTMFQFALGREFAVVFGIIALVAAAWAALLIEVPGFMPL